MNYHARHRAAIQQTASFQLPQVWIALAAIVAVLASVLANFTTASADSAQYTLGKQVVQDEFDRPTTAGWGTSTSGGKYSLSVANAFSTDGVSGLATPPRPGSSVTAILPGTTATDVQASTTVSLDSLPTRGNGVYAGIQVRSAAASHYLGSVRMTPDGRAYLSILRVVGSTASQVALVRDIPAVSGIKAGTVVNLEFRATGTTPVRLQARAWADGTATPAWQAVVDDSATSRIQSAGAVGLWAYISSGSDAQPVRFGALRAWQLDVAAPTTTPTVTPTVTPTTTPSPAPTATTAPAPAPTPTVPPTPTPTVPDGPSAPSTPGVRGTPGAAAVGSASYPVPSGAIFVSTTGSSTGTGSQSSPLATLDAAIAKATSGSTIVLRAGNYHGSYVIPTGKAITIQPYPGEEVWLDGSRVVNNWQRDGGAWVATGWTTRFDASPTYTRGAPDNTTAGWQFVNPAYPMAAHPDQVWINGKAQAQVGSRSAVVAGTFFVDYATSKLYLGSDPTGSTVRSSDTVKALVIAGRGSVIRGIGIERYSPSVPDMGAVQVAATDVKIENVTITDSATTGLAIFSLRTTLTDVSILNSGMLGGQASAADGLKATGMLFANNNTERFNRAPVSGGFKIHKSRGVTVADSAFLGNRGNGLWFDESVYDMTITGNDILDSVGNGIVIELSATAVVANNIVMRSERDGILVSDSGHVKIWNNTISANDRSINIVQGTRRASNLSLPGHDSRQTLPDPTVTWITEDVTVSNNVLAAGRGKCILCVEDYSHERSAAQMNIRSNGNVLQRISVTQPTWAIVWSRGVGNPAVYTSVPAFASATGQDVNSLALDGTPALSGTALTAGVKALVSSVARPLDSAVAAKVGQPAGARQLGAWV